jgi:hypothetical protein
MHSWLPEKTSRFTAKTLFKKDKQYRIEVLRGGYKTGSVIVRRSDGAVKAQGGVMLARVKMDLDPDSRMLMLPNGYNAAKSDLPTLVDDVAQRLARSQKCRLTDLASQQPELSSKVLTVEVFKTVGSEDVLLDRIFVDPDAHVPVRWDVFRDGKKISSVWFRNIRPNSGISDSLFKL